jgi:hypothetical protein
VTVTTTAHVNFRGQAREALSFYQSVFGGDLSLATYADIHSVESPEQGRRPEQSRDVTERMSRPQAAGRVPRRSRAVCPHPPGR